MFRDPVFRGRGVGPDLAGLVVPRPSDDARYERHHDLLMSTAGTRGKRSAMPSMRRIGAGFARYKEGAAV